MMTDNADVYEDKIITEKFSAFKENLTKSEVRINADHPCAIDKISECDLENIKSGDEKTLLHAVVEKRSCDSFIAVMENKKESDENVTTGYEEKIITESFTAFKENLTKSEVSIIADSLFANGKISEGDLENIESGGVKTLLHAVVEKRCCGSFIAVMENENSRLKKLIGLICKARSQPCNDKKSLENVSTDIGLSTKQRAAIRSELPMLKECINVERIIDELFSKRVISLIEKEEIEQGKTDRARMHKLLIGHVLKRTPEDFKIFMDVLTTEDPRRATKLKRTFDGMTEKRSIELLVVERLEDVQNKKQLESILEIKLKDISTGCIILNIEVSDWNEIVGLQDSLETGKLEAGLQKWFTLNSIDSNHVELDIDISFKDQHAEVLESDIMVMMIETDNKRCCWYWSIDDLHWCHVSRIVWPTGNQKGRIPKKSDREVLKRLLLQEIRGISKRSEKPCNMPEMSLVFGHSVEQIDVSLVVYAFQHIESNSQGIDSESHQKDTAESGDGLHNHLTNVSPSVNETTSVLSARTIHSSIIETEPTNTELAGYDLASGDNFASNPSENDAILIDSTMSNNRGMGTSQIGSVRYQFVRNFQLAGKQTQISQDTQLFKETETPVELLVYDDKGDGITTTWRVHPDGAALLRSISVPMYVIAIIGEYRTGKSYLMNRLSGKNDGFALGQTLQSRTKGIWIMVKKHPTVPDACMILLDSEGLYDVEKGDETHDMQIFTLILLLCNSLIFNTMHTLKDAIVKELHLVTELARKIQVRRRTESELNELYLSQHCPHLFVVIRDFFLDNVVENKKVTADEYLEHSLKPTTGVGSKAKAFNAPRECVRKYFKKRNCFVLCRPVDHEMDLRLLDEPGTPIRPEFLEQADQLVRSILQKTKPLKVRNIFITGNGLLALAEEFARALNDGEVPCIESSRDVMVAKVCQEAMILAFQQYTREMESMCSATYPRKQEAMDLYHGSGRRNAVATYEKHALLEEDEVHLQKLIEDIEDLYEKKFVAENNALSERVSRDAFKKCFSNMQAGIQGRRFIYPGGYATYQKEKKTAKDAYSTMPNLGPRKEYVLSEELDKLEFVESTIRDCDASLTAQQREQERTREEHNKAQQRALRHQAEIDHMQKQAQVTNREYQDLISRKTQEHRQDLQAKMTEYSQVIGNLQRDLQNDNMANAEKLEKLKQTKAQVEKERDEIRANKEVSLKRWETFNNVVQFGIKAAHVAVNVTALAIKAPKCSIM